jgi:hypothetical protein
LVQPLLDTLTILRAVHHGKVAIREQMPSLVVNALIEHARTRLYG